MLIYTFRLSQLFRPNEGRFNWKPEMCSLQFRLLITICVGQSNHFIFLWVTSFLYPVLLFKFSRIAYSLLYMLFNCRFVHCDNLPHIVLQLAPLLVKKRFINCILQITFTSHSSCKLVFVSNILFSWSHQSALFHLHLKKKIMSNFW